MDETSTRDELFTLIAKRLSLSEAVAAAKFASRQPIDDPARERKILDSVTGHSCNADGREVSEADFLRDQFEASKVIQRGLHRHWCDNPGDYPGTSRDLLAEVRPELDRITRRMLVLAPSVSGAPQGPSGLIDDLLAKSAMESAAVARFEDLWRAACAVALRSLTSVSRT